MNYRTGDLLFYPANKCTCLADSFTQYEHVSIISDSITQIEVAWPKIRFSKINWDFLNLQVWRMRDFDDHEAKEAAITATLYVGDWRDPLLGFLKFRRTRDCASLVYDAYDLKHKGFATPNSLIISKLVERVL